MIFGLSIFGVFIFGLFYFDERFIANFLQPDLKFFFIFALAKQVFSAVAHNLITKVLIATFGDLENMPAKLGEEWRTHLVEFDAVHGLFKFRDKHARC